MKISHSRHFTVAWKWLTIWGWLRISRSAMLGISSDQPMQQGDAAREPENDHGQIEHRPLLLTRPVGAILARFCHQGNRLPITVVSQEMLAAPDEQLCDCNRK